MQSLYQIPPQRKPVAHSVGDIVTCTYLHCLVVFKNSSLPTHCGSSWTIWPGIGSTASPGAKKFSWKESPPHRRVQAGEKVHVLLEWEAKVSQHPERGCLEGGVLQATANPTCHKPEKWVEWAWYAGELFLRPPAEPTSFSPVCV